MSFNKKVHSGYATLSGTTNFKTSALKKGIHVSHFKQVEDLYLSSLGMGTYLGNLSSKDDLNLESSIYSSIKEGCINVIDTAINYRSMLSEKSIGRAINRLINEEIIHRDELFICTKNGYFTNDGDFNQIDIESYLKLMYIDRDIIDRKDISSSYNIMNPNYIANCIDRSLCNMGLDTIDLVYIHNSFESWYDQVEKPAYYEMLSRVFEVYEEYRKRDKLRYYGMATWSCFTAQPKSPNYLSLRDVIEIAIDVGGADNGFKFIQLPYNSLMTEPYTYRNQQVVDSSQYVSILNAANHFGIHVFTSIPLFQGKLLSLKIDDKFLSTLPYESAKLLQFVRSTPGIVAPLVGQKTSDHTDQNIAISKYPLLTQGEFNEVLAAFDILKKQLR
ncbi:MAG TPA: aldo/keto reductase [Candidatus Nitrosocosmicus sp.]|nr:aldo/keto reductase [Candidatus Nitrosocosmicus sp.]